MNTQQEFMKVGIYVGTYGKYANGLIQGEWFYLVDYSTANELLEAIKKAHSDESDAEYMIQDTDNDFLKLFNESMSFDELTTAFETYEEIEKQGIDQSAAQAYVYCFGEWNIDDFNERIWGKFDSDEDLAYDYVEQTGMLQDIPESIQRYFDYESFGRDLAYDYSEHNGYYFLNN